MKKKKVKNIATYYKAEGTPIFRDTTALPFLTGGPLEDKTNHGKLLPSLYASSPGNYYAEGGQMIPPDCGPGQYYDEALGQCVPIKKPIIVESIDDPIYQDYLIRKQLYEHSQVPNYEQRDLATYTLRNDPNRLFNYQKFLENNKDVINDPESPEYLDDTKGPYGSATFKQRMTPKEFADFQKINNPRLSGYRTRINELTAKYPPAGYEIYTKETDSPYQYGIARNSGNWTIPNTAFLEDKINRDRLRQTYPALTDAEIDSWVLESRTTPEYISNTRNTEGNYNWLSGPGSEQTITSEDGSTSTEFVPTKYPDFNPPTSFRDPDTGQIGYYPDEILAYNKKLNYYLPYWNEPEPVRLKPIKMELRKPEPISINTKKLAGTPEENLPPSYPIPFTGMEWHDDYKTRINWGHKGVEYHLPRFRKPGHGGDLIKKGKSRYIHLPTLEKYNEAYLAPRDTYTIGDKLIRKFSGYNPEEMEGYQGGDAYYPGEIERAQEEGRRIEFQGYRNKADKALQEKYNRAYDKYEAQKGYEDMILQMSQKGINPFAYRTGGMLKRADGSYSKRGLWDNIRANAGSGKKPTKEMLAQERKINREYRTGGQFPRPYSLPEDSFKQGGNNLHNSIYASSPAQYPAVYALGGILEENNKCSPGYYWNGKECVKSFVPITKQITKQKSLTKNKKEQELLNYGKKTLPNKKVTSKPIDNIPFYGNISNAAQPDSFGENIAELADFTGYFSWDDAYRAKAAWNKSGSEYPSANQALDMFGAVPGLGKLGKLKYLKNANAIKNSMKYVTPAFGIIPWQQIVNTVDAGQDINQDNISYKNGGGMSSRFYASNVPDNNISNKDLTYPENSYVYRLGGRLIKKFK